MVRLSKVLKLLGLPPSDDVPVWPWKVGKRYEVVSPIQLVDKPDFLDAKCLQKLEPETTVVVLALCTICDEAGEEVLVAYLADTRKPEWRCGWGQVAGPGPHLPPALASKTKNGSWEIGGRYRVRGRPVLRATAELMGEAISELVGEDEEVLVLELALVILGKEPRLRCNVRTDDGHIGWITLELPHNSPMLDPRNLFRRDTVLKKPVLFCSRARPLPFAMRTRRRVSVSGSTALWEVGGKYRTLADLQLRERAEEMSKVLGRVRAGKLVSVERLSDSVDGGEPSWLRVRTENGRLAGWIGSTDSDGMLTLDARNQREWEELMERYHVPSSSSRAPPPAPETILEEPLEHKGADPDLDCSRMFGGEFAVQLQRPRGATVGIRVGDQEEHSLFIEEVLDDGAIAEWNKLHPDRDVRQGDRIIAVNGRMGDTEDIITALKEGGETLHMRIVRLTEAFDQNGGDPASPCVEGQGTSAEEVEPLSPESRTASEPQESYFPAASISRHSSGLRPKRRRSLQDRASPANSEFALGDVDAPQMLRRAEEGKEVPEGQEATVWRQSPKKALATAVNPADARGHRVLRIAEDEPDWQPFYEGVGEDSGNAACPCRAETCRETSFLAFLGCSNASGFKVFKEQG